MGKKRRQEILQRVQHVGYVSARELAEQYHVDTSTVRRDLDALARLGLVVRNHGGASLPSEPREASDVDTATRTPQKQAIARAVAAIIADGRSLLLDSGSTTLEVAKALRDHRGLTVVTNDLRVAAEMATHEDLRLIVIGGEVLPNVYTLMSERAVDLISEYHVDYAVLGADAIDPRGITNISSFEAPLKRALIRAGSKVVLVADSAKFGKSALVRVAGLEDVGLIVTDDGLTPEAAAAYPVEVLRVPVPPPAPPVWEPQGEIPEQGRSRRTTPARLPTTPAPSAVPVTPPAHAVVPVAAVTATPMAVVTAAPPPPKTAAAVPSAS